MRSVGSKDAAPARTKESRLSVDLNEDEVSARTTASSPVPGRAGDGSGQAGGQAVVGIRGGRHVYRVGGLRIPVKDPVRGAKDQSVARARDFLRKRAGSPVVGHLDPTVIEPPIRKPPAPRERPAFRDFSSSTLGRQPGRGRLEPDDDEDLDD
jgi:hypothetical protein